MDVLLVPPMTLAELFGPLAPLLVIAVLAGLAVLIALIATASWATRRAARSLGASAWARVAPRSFAAP
jgi:hypothetical protein